MEKKGSIFRDFWFLSRDGQPLTMERRDDDSSRLDNIPRA